MFEFEGADFGDANFHHLGYASRSIVKDKVMFRRLGYQEEGSPFEDPFQGIRGQFLVGGGPRIELIEDLPGFETVKPWLMTNVKLYHIAYEVRDLSWALGQFPPALGRVVVPPTAAAAFNMRNIAFVMFRSGFLVEFIQQGLV